MAKNLEPHVVAGVLVFFSRISKPYEGKDLLFVAADITHRDRAISNTCKALFLRAFFGRLGRALQNRHHAHDPYARILLEFVGRLR